jgi:hypothetical protein
VTKLIQFSVAFAASLILAAAASGPRIQTQKASAPPKPGEAQDYVGCLERLSSTGNTFILTNVRPASQKSTVSGTLLSNKSYVVIAADDRVDVASWAGYDVTVTGTMEENPKAGTTRTTATPEPGKDPAAAAAQMMGTITATSVKRHGMTCPS